MSRGIAQKQLSSTSEDQILCGVKNQMLMLLSSTVKYFLYPERVIQVQVKSNSVYKVLINPHQYLGWLFNVVPSQLFQEICIKSKNVPECLSSVKWCDLTWPCTSPRFNLHHLQKISTGYKMAVLTPKSDIHCSKQLAF